VSRIWTGAQFLGRQAARTAAFFDWLLIPCRKAVNSWERLPMLSL